MKDNINFIQSLISLLNKNPLKHSPNSIDIDSIPQPYFSYHLIERVGNRLESMAILLKGDATKLDFALNLIYRNILTDWLTTKFIFDKTEEQHNKIINLVAKDLERNNKNQDWVQQFSQHKEERINQTDKALFEQKLKEFPKHNERQYKLPGLFDIAKKNKNHDSFHYTENTFQLWNYLSKFEHVGWSSYYTTREYNNDGISQEEDVLIFIRYSIEIILLAISSLPENQIPFDFEKLNTIYNRVLECLGLI